jgi:sortase (surface protein transpeptidase)
MAADRMAVLALLLGTALAGCGGSAATQPAPVRTAPSPPPPAAAPPAVASFESSRTRRAVAVPVRLRIPAAGVAAPVQPLGRAADGTIEVPSRPMAVGWYAEGPRPGQRGPAVLLGHVDLGHRPAVFFRLAQLRPGALVYVDRADRSTARFRVTGRLQVPKDRFPSRLVYHPGLAPELRLVTCGGSFDAAARSYRDNVIVFAALA